MINAKDALAGTQTREQKIGAMLETWRNQLDASVRAAMVGKGSVAGSTFTYFGIHAFTEMEIEARDKFIAEVKAAHYRVTLHDSNDDNDYFMYKIDWSGA